jgi:hypothetical protein
MTSARLKCRGDTFVARNTLCTRLTRTIPRACSRFDAASKFLIGVFGSQRDRRDAEELGRRRSPKSVGWNVLDHYTACADHGSFTNPHIRQDGAVRSNEDILLMTTLPLLFGLLGPQYKRVQMEVLRPMAIVADRDVGGMQFIEIYKLANQTFLLITTPRSRFSHGRKPYPPRPRKLFLRQVCRAEVVKVNGSYLSCALRKVDLRHGDLPRQWRTFVVSSVCRAISCCNSGPAVSTTAS